MESQHIRHLRYSTFEIRLRAVEAVERGISQGHVASAYGIDRTTLYRWLANYHQYGIDGCESHTRQMREEIDEYLGIVPYNDPVPESEVPVLV